MLSRTRQHDVCPTCLGVKTENRLAEKFFTRRDGEPIPTPAQCVDAAAEAREHERAKTLAVIDRHLPARAAASPAPVPPPAPPPPPAPDPRVEVLQNELSQVRAAMELQLELTQEIAVQNRRLIEEQQRSEQRTSQLIEAVARMAGMTGRQNENLLGGIAQVANILGSLRDLATARPRPPARDLDALPPCRPLPPITRETPLTRGIDERLRGLPKPPPVDEEERARLSAIRQERVRERAAARMRLLVAAE